MPYDFSDEERANFLKKMKPRTDEDTIAEVPIFFPEVEYEVTSIASWVTAGDNRHSLTKPRKAIILWLKEVDE